MATEFEIGQFALGIAETAIGAALGFGLGLVGFHYQQKRQKEAEEEEQDNAVWDALNRLLYASSLNIESLANLKIQSINSLAPEVVKMKEAMLRTASSHIKNQEFEINSLKEVSRNLDFFYFNIPPVSIMESPGYKEFSRVIHEMPALTTFVHRSKSSMADLNRQVKERNELVDAYVLEFIGLEDSNESRLRYLYFNKMLTDYADSICITVDDCLAFHQLIVDQLHFYLKKYKKGRSAFEFKLLDTVKEQMPSTLMFADLRSQIVEFQD